MIGAIIAGSLISFVGGLLLLRARRLRHRAVMLTLPFGAGALLAAAFFDLMPEAFELGDARQLLAWTLAGFTLFFVLERLASWFHHHHEHDEADHPQTIWQRRLIVVGDLMHNAIDGLAIAAAFLVSVPTGIVTTLAVGAHEIPKELGTFALLLSRGWSSRKVILVNLGTIIATLIAAVVVYFLGSDAYIPTGPLLAMTAGFFIYVAASDIIPDIHEQPRRVGTIQAAMLVIGIVLVATIITLLGV